MISFVSLISISVLSALSRSALAYWKPSVHKQNISVPDPWSMVWIRGSMPLNNGWGSGSCYFRPWPTRRQQKTNLKKSFFFCLLLLKVNLHNFSKIKSPKEAKKQYESRFFLLFSLEGSGSIPLTSGTGSGRPKNMWNTAKYVNWSFMDSKQ